MEYASAVIPENDIAELIRGAAHFGERPALRYRTEYRAFSWSYGQLHDATLRMAQLLERQGIGRGDRVLLWAPNSPSWVVAFLGCLLRGGVAVPVDVCSRPSFLRDVARETQAKLLVRSRFQEEPGLGVPSIVAEDLERLLTSDSHPRPALPSLDGRDLAEIVYTSGTTARPKGVVLTHGNLAAELRSVDPLVPFEREYRFLVLLPFSHIFAQVLDLFLPLSRGGTIVIPEAIKPDLVATSLRRDRITVLGAVPRLLEMLRDRVLQSTTERALVGPLFWASLTLARQLPFELRRPLLAPLRRALGPELKYVISGGAALDPDLERFWDGLGFVTLQGYGLTETTSAVTADRVDARRIGSVGLPLPEQEVRLGEEDEVLVRGPNLTPGYYRNPQATAASFLDGWFRTGDVGRLDDDGFLYIRGRLKEVIVTAAGVNVYPEDVEGVLAHQPGVRDAAVVEWQGAVHAVLLLEPGSDPRRIVGRANRDLDSSQQIQGYDIWPFPDFPRTPTLKVRKRDVLDFLAGRALRGEAVEQAKGPASRLAALIARLSPAPGAASRADATLGLDLQLSSLDRLELVSLIEQELNVDLADEEITAQITVGELERLVRERRALVRRSFPRWSRWPFMRAPRGLIQRWLLFPVLGRFVRLKVEGRQHLDNLTGPAIFAPNHQTDLDTPVIYMALPKRFRERIAAAAWAEYFDPPGRSWPFRLLRRLLYCPVVLLANAFPLSHTHVVRASIKYMGELVEEGENLLIFPEGRRSPTGEILPFEQGIGLIALALRVPIVPVRLDGLWDVLPGGSYIPRPGRVAVKFGRPLVFDETSSYQEIAQRVEEAVRALSQPEVQIRVAGCPGCGRRWR